MTTTINASTSSGLVNTADTSGILQLQTASTAAVTINASQNVGVGMTDQTKKLETTGTLATRGSSTNTTWTGAGELAIKNGSGNAYMSFHGDTGTRLSYMQTSSTATELNAETGYLAFSTNAERMRITSTGNVGVGTTTPTDSSGYGQCIDGNSSTGFGYYARQAGSSTNFLAMGISSSNAVFSLANTTGYMGFYTNAGTERMRIDSLGRITINGAGVTGQVSISNNNNLSGLAIITSDVGFPIEAQVTKASNVCPGVRSRVTNNAAGTGYQAFTYYNDNSGDYLFKVLGNGNVQNANNSYGSTSDVKLKENIVDATPKLEDLCKVKVRQYNFKKDPNKTKQIGVVAQELEEVFAGLVEETVDRDVDGLDLGTTTKQVKYSVFVPMLIKAIQEQQALITDLTTRLAALEGAK